LPPIFVFEIAMWVGSSDDDYSQLSGNICLTVDSSFTMNKLFAEFIFCTAETGRNGWNFGCTGEKAVRIESRKHGVSGVK